MVVQIKVNELSIGVAVLYNPSCTNPNFSQHYEKVLLDMLDFGFDRTYIVGDFNINVAAGSPSAKATSVSNISDHEVVYLVADIRVHRTCQRTIRARNFRNIDQLQLQADFQAKDLRRLFGSADINEKATVLNSELTSLLDAHAPERTVTIRDERTPWITQQIKEAVELRNLALKLYARNPNRTRGDVQWLDFERKRDRASSLIFAAKKRYAELNFSHDLPAKKLWSNLKRDGIHNSTKQCSSSADISADELNNFFSDGHRRLGPAATQRSAPRAPNHRTAIDHGANGFSFRHTSVEEICRKIFEIDTNATGTDGIPISFLKMLCPFILPVLCHLFNAIIDSRTFPALWKTAIVTPIPKTSNPALPKDYRPISVLPAVSKVLEKILLNQITEHLDNPNNRLLARNQSGYRKGYGTTTALAKVTHDIYGNLDAGRCTAMVLVDFSLAFNCVDHHLLAAKLNREFQFSGPACELVSSFLRGRKQSVRHGSALSAVREVTDGTPQGPV
ncbi:uncharacterized protein LOC119769207 [Culex quinquefasciatus]|uniref:uncharacterized protein LOC119769207 n=1 Tax=Culex quinquefasciatus TaxID=7176 RepID=UPI0018E3EDF3|nr:uncharacterized protein LOC119769207 [Culex quinquefasciatus]